MNELEKLIALSKVVAKPWVIATWVLAIFGIVRCRKCLYDDTKSKCLFRK